MSQQNRSNSRPAWFPSPANRVHAGLCTFEVQEKNNDDKWHKATTYESRNKKVKDYWQKKQNNDDSTPNDATRKNQNTKSNIVLGYYKFGEQDEDV